MKNINPWLKAFRLRTLPLAFSSIILGGALALKDHLFSLPIFLLTLLTTLFLQILSNLANDYGDFIKGTDNENRIGPKRTVQAGLITPGEMKGAMILFSVLAFISGLSLLYVSNAFSELRILLFFLGLGVMCIIAAITYTVGKNAYGYKGFGDISVLLFFGLVGVIGTNYLMTKELLLLNFIPAIAAGLLATGVLNLNNIRDIENDKKSGKNSIPVLIGFKAGKVYHSILIITALALYSVYVFNVDNKVTDYVPLIMVPLFLFHLIRVNKTKINKDLDPFLKQLALFSLFTSLLFFTVYLF